MRVHLSICVVSQSVGPSVRLQLQTHSTVCVINEGRKVQSRKMLQMKEGQTEGYGMDTEKDEHTSAYLLSPGSTSNTIIIVSRYF